MASRELTSYHPGIGAAVAKGFARSGCSRIAITDLNRKSLADTQDAILQISPKAQIVSQEGDISDEGFVNSFVRDVAKTFSRIDYSVSCAGILGESLRSHETPTAAFDLITNVNYKGTWLASRAVLSHMLKQAPHEEHPEQRGAIVNIASQLGVVARPAAGKSYKSPIIISDFTWWHVLTCFCFSAPYCASKAAIINMTRSDAIDYSQDGIRVNCVCPGVIATPMTTSSDELIQRLRPAIDIAPMRRMGTPEEVAHAVLFLCSSQASFVQGHAMVVDGGYTIN